MKLGIVGAAALVVACGASKPLRDPGDTPTGVTLLEGGQEPRALLRYAVPANVRIEGQINITVTGAATGLPGQASGGAPVMRIQVDVEPTEHNSGGTDFDLRLSNGKSRIPENTPERRRELATEALAALDDMQIRIDVNNRGVSLEPNQLCWDDKGPVDPRLLMVLGNVCATFRGIALPAAPMGLGAVWEVQRPVRIGDARLTTIARYKLTDRAGDQMRISMHMRQTGGPEKLEASPGQKIELLSHQADAIGFLIVDLAAPLALEAYSELQGSTAFERITAGGVESVREQQASLLRLMMLQPTSRILTEEPVEKRR